MFDWQPRGTLPPDDWNSSEAWDPMNYFWNYGQMVTSVDANALGDAINRAVDMLEEKKFDESIEQKFGEDWEQEMIRRWRAALIYGLKDPAFIFFDLSWEEKLMKLVYFCRQGNFLIF